ncbi:MAG: hypothetical protein JXR94_00800, partial [Candidatus Hydrogenedentes bacterium]|nr:hypothetical protein [Candidatus Hydrogenedentota bacterium]
MSSAEEHGPADAPAPDGAGSRGRWANLALLIVAVLAGGAICEAVLRHRYAHLIYTPRPEVQAVQAYLELDPDLGFTWRPNVRADEQVVFEVADVEFEPLTTDEHGFNNAPGALAERRAGRSRFDMVGVGDSFMEHACRGFHDAFEAAGLAYYSLAMHRHSPPQYNVALREYALGLEPAWVVYGLFENDFAEAHDYEDWRGTGLDWFAYHSGTWCGPPVGTNRVGRAARRYLRGFYSFYRVVV